MERGIPGCPKIRHEPMGPYFERLVQRMRREPGAFPTWVGELYLEYHRGTLTSVATNKRNNRLAEQALHPDNLLKGLVAWLEAPENHLRIESSHVAVADQQGGWAELPLMRCADRRQWVISLVRISVQEALNALASESRCHRYILV
jgi:hypothetical protein